MMSRSQAQSWGWMAVLALCAALVVVLSFKVHAVRSEVLLAERALIALQRETLLLETEFETRASQSQLAQWNNVEFGYTSPRARQFLDGERQLASLGQPFGPNAPAPLRLARAEAEDGVVADAPMRSPVSGAAVTLASAASEQDAGEVFAQAFGDFLIEASPIRPARAQTPKAAGIAAAQGGGRMNTLAAPAAIPALPAGRLRHVNLRSQMLWTAQFRVLWISAGFALVMLIALLRIAVLGMGGHAPQRTSLEEALLPPRGEITDRNGAPLARAFPAYALWFDPKAMGDSGAPLVHSPAEVAAQLKAIFPDIDEAHMARRLASGRAGYLRRRLLPEEANRVFALGEIALEIPRETDRYYPQGKLAAHVLGYVVEGEGGKIGMEEVLEKDLTNPDTRAAPVALSIDVRVQGALEDELRKGMLATNAIGAAGVVLDVDTGEVMALASLPEFDPNTAGASGATNVFNRATNGVYELGSTFKPLSIAAAIDAGVVRDLGKAWDASPVAVGKRTIKDLKPKGASLNVPQALVYSSNTVTARVADELGAERLRRTMMDLGMNTRPFIELPAKGRPIWPQGQWSRVTNMTVSYGHGLAVTPLHLASAYATMVNGGIWRPSTLRKLNPANVPRGRRVFKESTSHRMRQMLRMISLYGTGKSADAPGYRVGGKTGSAEKASGGGYNKTSLVSSFAAAFPLDAPRYVVVIVVDEPKGTVASSFQRTAAFTAAPVVGKLVPRIGPMLGVQPDETRDVDISDLRYLVDKH